MYLLDYGIWQWVDDPMLFAFRRCYKESMFFDCCNDAHKSLISKCRHLKRCHFPARKNEVEVVALVALIFAKQHLGARYDGLDN